jgi:CYTH domain-containing protein
MPDAKLKTEIERKFFPKTLPDLSGVAPVAYERYFLERGNGVEVRIQRKGTKFTYQRKTEVAGVGRSRDEDREISAEEFERLKVGASAAIVRTRYDLPPLVALQVYGGAHEGLVRYEVEFPSTEAAAAFVPEPWMGEEITESPLGRDALLLDLTPEEFRRQLARYIR